MGRRRVAERDSDFDQYIQNTSKILENGSPIGSVRLGLSNNEKIQWLAYRDEWVALYPKYTNEASRTKVIKKEKNNLKQKFTAFAARPLNKIAWSNNITQEDRNVFNLPARKTTRAHRGAMHGDIPLGDLHGIGGSRIKVRARIEEAAGRCRKHPLADAVEMKYLVMEVERNYLKPMVTVNDCTHSVISKKASFVMEAGQENLGKRLAAFLRWVNFSNPANNGPWSQMLNVIVG